MAQCRVPLSQIVKPNGTAMMRLPDEVLTKRLGRPLRHKPLASVFHKKRCCNGNKAQEKMTVYQVRPPSPRARPGLLSNSPV